MFNFDETNFTNDPGMKKCFVRRGEDNTGVKYYYRPADESRSATIYTNNWHESTQMGWSGEELLFVEMSISSIHEISGHNQG